MKKNYKEINWAFILTIITLLSWLSVFFSIYGIILLQSYLFLIIFIFFPIISLILSTIKLFNKSNKSKSYGTTLFTLIISILHLVMLIVFGTSFIYF